MPSIPETIFLLLAISRLGGIAVMCNADYIGLELQHCIAISKPHAILCSSRSAYKLEDIDSDVLEGSIVLLLPMVESGTTGDGVWHFCEEDNGNVDIALLPSPQPQSWNDVTLMVFSSGTSGLPKAVELSHRALISVFSLGISACYFNLSKRETAFICMPIHHVGGICTWLMNTIRGDCCAFMSAQRPARFESWADAIIRWRCNKLAATPTSVRAFVKQGLCEKIGAAGCVNVVNVGAGSLSPWLFEVARRAFKCPILHNWGMSELAGGVVRASAYWPNTSGSVGRLCGDVQARIVDETDNDVDGRGHLLIKSSSMMNGYFDDERATREAIDEDGWLRTGDLAYFNENQELFIVDRIKDLIKYKGWSIAPAELEAILETHDQVVEAAVIGTDANDANGEMVSTIPGRLVGQNELILSFSPRLSSYCLREVWVTRIW
jgi:acyl-coenzyme A synthetase/AMP-(fatty) acid ligase